jgi:hypothetical protein
MRARHPIHTPSPITTGFEQAGCPECPCRSVSMITTSQPIFTRWPMRTDSATITVALRLM